MFSENGGKTWREETGGGDFDGAAGRGRGARLFLWIGIGFCILAAVMGFMKWVEVKIPFFMDEPLQYHIWNIVTLLRQMGEMIDTDALLLCEIIMTVPLVLWIVGMLLLIPAVFMMFTRGTSQSKAWICISASAITLGLSSLSYLGMIFLTKKIINAYVEEGLGYIEHGLGFRMGGSVRVADMIKVPIWPWLMLALAAAALVLTVLKRKDMDGALPKPSWPSQVGPRPRAENQMEKKMPPLVPANRVGGGQGGGMIVLQNQNQQAALPVNKNLNVEDKDAATVGSWNEIPQDESDYDNDPPTEKIAPRWMRELEEQKKENQKNSLLSGVGDYGFTQKTYYDAVSQQTRNPGLILFQDTRNPSEIYGCDLINPVIIGRDPRESNVVVPAPDKSVSRKHCRLYQWNGVCLVEDLGTVNHTYVNQMQVTNPMPLHQGDRLTMGNVEFLVIECDMNK